MDADFSVKFPQKGNPELSVNGQATQVALLGKNIDVVMLNGAMEENLFKGILKVDDNDLALDFNGLIDFQDYKYPKSDFEAVIWDADLSALQIMKGDSISRISTRIYANMTGFDIDDLEGSLRLDSTLYRDSRGHYFMKSFNASIINDNLMMRRINMNCDFFNFEMAGQMNFASMMMSLNEYADSFVHFPRWEDNRKKFQEYSKKHDVDQDFMLQLTLKDSNTLSRLFMPSVHIANNTSLTGTYTSRTNSLSLTARSKNVQVGTVNLNDIELKHTNFMTTAITSLSLGEVVYGVNDTTAYGLDNLSLVARMANDTIFTRLKWDDVLEEDHNKALIETYFHPHEKGGIFSLTKADIVINDSLWTASPNNFINIADGRTALSNIMLSHNSQLIRLDGFVPLKAEDTLSVMMRRFDLSNLDVLLNAKGIDVDGFASGDVLLSSVKDDPMVLANLNVEKLGVNGDYIGDASVVTSWDNTNKAIGLNAGIFDKEKQTLKVEGSYFTARKDDNLDFLVMMDSLRLAALSPLLTGVVSRMQGYGNGQATIKGSIDQPDIEGRLVLDGGCKVDYLNTFYTFKPTVLIDNQSIRFDNMVLVDTLGNKALVDGGIKHNKLKDFYLDLKLHPMDFLAMATTSKDNDSFYGTAVADGIVSVKGPFKDIVLDIKARTKRGTNFVIPLNKSTTVKDNDFIVFINKEVEEDQEEETRLIEKTKGNLAINMDINATDDASLKIYLPGNIGTIDAVGNGNVKMSTSSTEDFSMYGNYTIKTGRFQLVLMEVVNRTFNLKEGGSLSWSGNPTDGRINATGSYTVRTSLSSLGIQVDSTSTNSNVNVECLIHLKGALLNPTITFGMRLPNASEDITQTVYSLVDTTNQSVMTQQALSLLVLNTFAYVGTSVDNLNVTNILGGGMQMDITENVNVGLRYHLGDANSSDEYQLALRTELFKNRLTIETNVGVLTGNAVNNASNIVGEFDMYYKLTKDGRLQAHFYNHSNYNSNFNSVAFDKRSPYTQGLGLSYSRSFDSFRNLFKKKTVTPNQPLMRPNNRNNN